MAMLCCVSRKAASPDEVDSSRLSRLYRAASLRKDEEAFRSLDEAVLNVNALANTFSTFASRKPELPPEDAQTEVPLEPCRVCGRNFNLHSLEKHERICERTAAKKRKPFDSAKQRIQGTELAEFLPKLRATDSTSSSVNATSTRTHHEHHPQGYHTLGRRSSNTGLASGSRGSDQTGYSSLHHRQQNVAWKQTHDEFLRAIRAARGDNSSAQHQYSSHPSAGGTQSSGGHQAHHQPQSSPSGNQQHRPTTLSLQVTSQGVPTRPNEKGICPTCHRQFGVKSYERHVAFCKERSTRVPASPLLGNNVAKERLEARMKYRAPGLKNRRQTNKEKYSPGNHGHVKTIGSSRSPVKEPSGGTTSAPATGGLLHNGGRGDHALAKLPVLKRSMHSSKESLASSTVSSGPLKSRPMDRSNSKSEPSELLNPPALRQLFASRRLLLLSEVLPSKIIKSKNPRSASKSPMSKTPTRVETLYTRRSTQDFNAKITKRTSKKKTKIRPPEDDEEETNNETSCEDIAWKQRFSEDPDYTIDKEVEPVLSQVTIQSGSQVLATDGQESDNDTIKNESDSEYNDTTLDRTYTLEDDYQEPVSQRDDFSYENTRVCTHISEEEEEEGFDKSSESGTIKSPSNCQMNPVEVKPTVILSMRARKTQSLPNVGNALLKSEELKKEEPQIVIEVANADKNTCPPESKERCVTYNVEESRTTDLPQPPPEPEDKARDRPMTKENASQEKWHLHRCERLPSREKARQTEVVSLYKNDAAANYMSDVTSVTTSESPPRIEYDSDYLAETESNGSELIKEIDCSNYTLYENDYSSGSPMDYCSRRKLNRRNDTSSSTIQATERLGTPAPRQHYEKEICTITRLDSMGRKMEEVDVAEEEEEFGLPSIGWRKHRTEYHREKLVKAREKPGQTCFPVLRRIFVREKRSLLRRSFERLPRCDWNSYIRRHPDFSMILRNRIGLGQEYNPFLLAEQQLNDLFSDTSDQSSNDGSSICPNSQKAPNSPVLPLSPSSAFAKYPPSLGSTSPQSTVSSQPGQQRASVIAPPMAFDDLTSDVSSDCTEVAQPPPQQQPQQSRPEKGRRMIIDQSQALGGGEFAPVSRSNSNRAPKPPERKTPFILHSGNNNNNNNNKFSPNTNNNNYKNNCLNGSASSLSSDPTDAMMKRSNSLFDELLSSFEEDCSISTGGTGTTLPSLMSLMRNDPAMSLLTSSQNGGTINGRAKNNTGARIQCSDDDADLSSPESLKGKECAPKLSADSAYSSSNDVSNASSKFSKLSKFCHECGFKFPDQAKFCCECGVKRITI